MSFSSRIIARLTITSCIAACIAYGWLYLKQSRVQEHLHERSLLQQAREISEYLSVNGNGQPELNLPPALYEAYNRPGSTYRYVIRDDSGRIVARSSGHAELPMVLSGTKGAREWKRKNVDDDAMLPVTVAGRMLTIGIDERLPASSSLNSSVFNEFITDGGWLGIPFICALLLVSAYTVRKTFSPLGKLSSIAAQINPGNTGVRLPQTGIPQEILPAVHAINAGLDRLDDGFSRQREFCANVAHQLRTPLAVLSANIDLMADKIVAAKLRYDVDSTSCMVSQLLLVAKLEVVEYTARSGAGPALVRPGSSREPRTNRYRNWEDFRSRRTRETGIHPWQCLPCDLGHQQFDRECPEPQPARQSCPNPGKLGSLHRGPRFRPWSARRSARKDF